MSLSETVVGLPFLVKLTKLAALVETLMLMSVPVVMKAMR